MTDDPLRNRYIEATVAVRAAGARFDKAKVAASKALREYHQAEEHVQQLRVEPNVSVYTVAQIGRMYDAKVALAAAEKEHHEAITALSTAEGVLVAVLQEMPQ